MLISILNPEDKHAEKQQERNKRQRIAVSHETLNRPSPEQGVIDPVIELWNFFPVAHIHGRNSMTNEERDPQLKSIRQNNDDLHRIHECFQHLSKRKSNC